MAEPLLSISASIDLAAFQAASEPVYAAVAEAAGQELTQRIRDAASSQ